jgi:hypothetical protein
VAVPVLVGVAVGTDVGTFVGTAVLGAAVFVGKMIIITGVELVPAVGWPGVTDEPGPWVAGGSGVLFASSDVEAGIP